MKPFPELLKWATPGPAHKIALRKANVEVVSHLLTILKRHQCYKTKKKTGITHLIWMCEELLKRGIADFPPDKSGRWIGFVQGCMACRGLLNVDAERDRTRPLYTAAYMNGESP